MRSLTQDRAGFAALMIGTLSLTGCLVSETPILDANTGKAKALKDGAYQVCDGTEDPPADCNIFSVTRDASGAYALTMEGEDPASMRIRRVARNAYAVQSAEDDGYAYYFGAGNSQKFLLTLMNCQDLPPVLRRRLIDKNDLSTESDDFEICTVNTLKGLTEAAKAYHRGETTGDDPAFMVMTPAVDAAN